MLKSLSRLMIMASLVLCFGTVWAEDWPQLQGPRRDGISREKGLLKAWPKDGPKVLWRAPLGVGSSCMAVADGRVFTQFQKDGAQWAVAFDEKTGKELWKVRTGIEFKAAQGDGPHSTPTVDGPRVYVMNARGNLFCLDAATGRTIWKQDLLDDPKKKPLVWGAAVSPLVDGPRLLVSGGWDQGASMRALDKLTGKLIWKALDERGGYSSPRIQKLDGIRQAVLMSGAAALGLVPETGRVLWRIPRTPPDADNVATPLVMGNKVFVCTSYQKGSTLIQVGNLATSATIKTIWNNKSSLVVHFTTPLLLDGYLYAFDDHGYRCVKMETGEVKWTVPGIHECGQIMADGLAYILDGEGKLILARLSPGRMEKLSEVSGLVGPKCWTMPVVANGRLYLRDESKLLCLDIRAQTTK